MYDIALPHGNENELLEKYRELGYKYVIFLYLIKSKSELTLFKRENICRITKFPGIYCFVGAILDTLSIKDTLHLAAELFYNEKLYNDFLFVKAGNYKYTQLLSNKHYFNSILLDLDAMSSIEDPLQFRYTGFSFTTLKNIIRNNLTICISIRNLASYINLGRVLYLIKHAKKKGIPLLLGSFARDVREIPQDIVLRSWYKLLKIPYTPEELTNIMLFQLIRTRRAKNKDVFCNGYEIVKYPFEDFEDSDY